MGEPHFVSCATWIKKGVCKEKPIKTKLSKAHLAKWINAPSKFHERSDAGDECDDEDSVQQPDDSAGSTEEAQSNMSAYDDDDKDETQDGCASALSTSPGADNLLYSSGFYNDQVVEECSDSDSDDEELRIGSDENMIVTGQVDGDTSHLILYVFDESQGSVFQHHDIMLSSYPTCVEWLNFDANSDSPGNLVAVGGMLPMIEVWPVDELNCIQPVYSLGEQSQKPAQRLANGHTDAVTCLAWNNHLEHVLASGSADGTVVLWDLHGQCQSAKLAVCTNKQVQTVRWRLSDNNNASQLLTGDSKSYVSLWECKTEERKRWKLTGEVEQVVWDHFSSDGALAVTDNGMLHYIDVRQEKKAVWSVQAHQKDCTGLWLSDRIPGCALTTSSDGCVRVWDTTPPSSSASSPSSSAAHLVAENELKLGSLYCVSGCSDLPWTVCLGGDNKDNSMYVWDIRHLDSVRERFGQRIDDDTGHRENISRKKISANDVNCNHSDGATTAGAAKSNADSSAAKHISNISAAKHTANFSSAKRKSNFSAAKHKSNFNAAKHKSNFSAAKHKSNFSAAKHKLNAKFKSNVSAAKYKSTPNAVKHESNTGVDKHKSNAKFKSNFRAAKPKTNTGSRKLPMGNSKSRSALASKMSLKGNEKSTKKDRTKGDKKKLRHAKSKV